MKDLSPRYCHRLLAPRIGFLVGTHDESAGDDVAPISNLTQVSSDPQLFAIAVYKEWTTHANIQKSGRFVVSVPRSEHADVVWKLGNRFSGFPIPDGIDKIDASGGTFDRELSSYGPVLSDATGWCECEVVTAVELPDADHGLFIAKVTRGGYNPSYMNQDGSYSRNSTPLMQVVLNQFATTTDSWEQPWLGPNHP